MDIEQCIKVLCVKSGITMATLAKRMNMSPQSLHQKIKRRSFSIEDLKTIAVVTNSTFDFAFVLTNGERINL